MLEYPWRRKDLEKVVDIMRDVGDISRIAFIYYLSTNPHSSSTELSENALLRPYYKNSFTYNMRILINSGIAENSGGEYSLTGFGHQLPCPKTGAVNQSPPTSSQYYDYQYIDKIAFSCGDEFWFFHGVIKIDRIDKKVNYHPRIPIRAVGFPTRHTACMKNSLKG